MSKHSKSIIILLLCMSCLLVRGTEKWTGWLGSDRTGWVDGFEPPLTWPERLTQVWRIRVGTGYGSPLVSDGRIYLHTREGKNEVTRCLSLEDGIEIWREQLPVPFRAAPGGEFHGPGPKASPFLTGQRLFTMSITGTLSAWDSQSGSLTWSQNYDDEFGQSHPNWGASTSPIADADKVYVHFGTDKRGALVAMEQSSGKEIWRLGDDGPSYSSPLIAELEGIPQIIEWNHRALVGTDLKDGERLWEFPFPHIGPDQNMPTPQIHQGRILLGGENRGIHSIHPELKDGKWAVTDRWHTRKVSLNMSSAVMNGGFLFGLSHFKQGQYFCLDPENGEVLWEGPPRTAKNATFLSMPGHVAALVDHGLLQIIKANPRKFEITAEYRVAEDRTWAPPVFLSEGVLIKDHEHLTLWSF